MRKALEEIAEGRAEGESSLNAILRITTTATTALVADDRRKMKALIVWISNGPNFINGYARSGAILFEISLLPHTRTKGYLLSRINQQEEEKQPPLQAVIDCKKQATEQLRELLDSYL